MENENKETIRKLATVRMVAEITPIPEADTIEAVRVDGWICVAKKGDFQVGKLAVYLEIDSWVPHTIAPFLTKPDRDPKVFEGVEGERLRTIKLRGQISQGLLLPITVAYAAHNSPFYVPQEGEDLTELLGIKKWERALHPSLAGTARGNFPSFLRKTDEERVQNLPKVLEQYAGESFEETLKLDGSSCTMYFLAPDSKYLTDEEKADGRFGVCSRNLDLKNTETNAFWNVAREFRVEEKLKELGRSIAIQGELIGPTIQNNHERMHENGYFVFKVWDIEAQEMLSPIDRRAICEKLDLKHTPVLNDNVILSEKFKSVQEILLSAEGPGMNEGVSREGVVYKHNRSDFSFKAISNAYLAKEKD